MPSLTSVTPLNHALTALFINENRVLPRMVKRVKALFKFDEKTKKKIKEKEKRNRKNYDSSLTSLTKHPQSHETTSFSLVRPWLSHGEKLCD